MALTATASAQTAKPSPPQRAGSRTACCLNSSVKRRRGRRLCVSAIADIVSTFRKMSTKPEAVQQQRIGVQRRAEPVRGNAGLAGVSLDCSAGTPVRMIFLSPKAATKSSRPPRAAT